MAGTFVPAGRFGNRWLRKWWKEKNSETKKGRKEFKLVSQRDKWWPGILN